MALQKKRIRNPAERKRAHEKYYTKTKISRREKRLAATKKWLSNNPEYHKAYSINNRGIVNAKTAKRRAVKLQATPKWLTKLQWSHITLFYNAAASLSKELGIKIEVDHIVPLQGEIVSGLHVPWNLQVLRLEDNRSKGNTYGSY